MAVFMNIPIHFGIDKSIEYKLEEPYNDCKLMADETYRRVNCLAQCKNEKEIESFNCTRRNFYSNPDYEYCDKRLSIDLTEFDLECLRDCPRLSFPDEWTDGRAVGWTPEGHFIDSLPFHT